MKDLFNRFATGSCSLELLVAQLRKPKASLSRRGGFTRARPTRFCASAFTWGEFDWDGGTYQGTHEPLVTRHCWERVQGLLDARAESKTRKVKT